MRFIHVLSLAVLASSTTVPAAAQGAGSGDVRVLRTPRARIEMGFQDENRAVIGVSTTATGTVRDTLGLMITSITKNSPAERAGLEEGNRIAAINGVSLRASAADIEDAEMSGALSRRLTRELSKAKPGDEVELRVYREGRTQAIRVKTVDADSLFRRREVVRTTRAEMENRPALGFSIGSTGSRRDTLGVLVMAVADSTPAAKAGIEEGNRIAAINGVNLRVAREDAGDRYLGSVKAQRLQRELAGLKPGSDVTLRVYSNGQFRDVTMKVARAGDLPRSANTMFLGGFGRIAPLPPMPALPALPPRAPMLRGPGSIHMEIGPEIEAGLHGLGAELEHLRPQLDRFMMELPRALQEIRIPNITIDVEAAELAARQAQQAARAAAARVRTTVM